eukprot:scaffold82622_cov29-Phaeocystis_antarctica.AAC.1
MRTSDRGRRSPQTATAPGTTAARTRSPTTGPPPSGRPPHPASTSRSARAPTTGTPSTAGLSQFGSSSSSLEWRRIKPSSIPGAARTRRGACTALSTRGAYWAPPRACRLTEQAALRKRSGVWVVGGNTVRGVEMGMRRRGAAAGLGSDRGAKYLRPQAAQERPRRRRAEHVGSVRVGGLGEPGRVRGI